MAVLSVNNLTAAITAKGGMAKANRFEIELPIDFVEGTNLNPSNPNDLNVFCKAVNMPGKQILSAERRVGSAFSRIAYAYGSQDVQMTFHLTRDLDYKKYFENWQQATVNNSQNSQWHGPAYLEDYARSVKIHQLAIDGSKTYSIELLKAYPTTVNPIQYTDDGDNILELSVELSYKRWIEL